MRKAWILFLILTPLLCLGITLDIRWEDRYADQNALAVEKAKAAIERGQEYAVLAENDVFLTDDAHFSDLLYFLEGHFGVQVSDFDEETVVLEGDYGGMTFTLTEITSFGKRYLIWEREQ